MRRARYRLAQFGSFLWPRPLRADELSEVGRWLSPPLMALFQRQTAGEQAHSLRVMRTVAESGAPCATRPELLQAALLHDVGKCAAPLNLIERVVVVLVQWLWLGAAAEWGQEQQHAWQRPFVTALHHAEWGAELCAQAGAPPLTVDLIRRHQSPVTVPITRDDEMLLVLQAADDDN